MKIVLSYCSARMFLEQLLPMAAIGPRQPRGAVNDNNPPRRVAFIDKSSRQRASTTSPHFKRATYKLTGSVVAAIVVVAGILALLLLLLLLLSLVVPATTVREARSDVIRGSPIAPALLEPRERG